MQLLTSNDRKDLVERICTRFHKEGISRLKTVGHFEKYTPLFHFTITEPNDEDFIFITELFGDIDTKPGLMQRGTRMQYHGNYHGVSKIFVQGIHDGMIIPDNGFICINSAFRLEYDEKNIPQKIKENFDNSLRYIDHVLRLTIPETRRLDVNPETFSSTYYLF